MLKQQHQLFITLLAIVDAFVVAFAAYAAWAIRRMGVEGFWPRESWETYVKEPAVLFVVPVVLGVMWIMGLYRARRDRALASETVQIAKVAVVSVAVLIVLLWTVGNNLVSFQTPYGAATVLGVKLEAGRVQFALLALALTVCLGAERAGVRMALRHLRRRGWNLRHVAVIGVGRLGQIVGRTLERNSWTGLRVEYFIGHTDTTRRQECLGRPVLGGLDDLESILSGQKIDAVYIALPTSRAHMMTDVLSRLEKFAVDVRVVPDVNPRHLPQSMTVSELDGMPILSYRECPTHGLGGLSKRVLDIVGALAGIVVLSPVMLIVSALVRISGPGPVIFRQRRVSLGGQVFWIYKFRTMTQVEAEPQAAAEDRLCECGRRLGDEPSVHGWVTCPACGKHGRFIEVPEWTRRDDARITPIGAWLRRTSLDELPQLFNVMSGSMSLVGPRPERPELIERFREDWRGYMLRQHVKAGMTGWAQINGLRGQTSLRKRLQYDLFYIRHWSIGFDLRILLMTPFRGFVHRNAH